MRSRSCNGVLIWKLIQIIPHNVSTAYHHVPMVNVRDHGYVITSTKVLGVPQSMCHQILDLAIILLALSILRNQAAPKVCKRAILLQVLVGTTGICILVRVARQRLPTFFSRKHIRHLAHRISMGDAGAVSFIFAGLGSNQLLLQLLGRLLPQPLTRRQTQRHSQRHSRRHPQRHSQRLRQLQTQRLRQLQTQRLRPLQTQHLQRRRRRRRSPWKD